MYDTPATVVNSVGRSRTAKDRIETCATADKEFSLLRALASEPTRVFTKAELLRDVWGYRSLGRTRQ